MSRVSGRFLRVSLLGLALLATLSACTSSDSGSVLDLKSAKVDKAQQEQVLQSELSGFCPQVTLREGTAYFTIYEKGGEGDATRAIYQASITEVTRACRRENGVLTINVAAAGRVVPGPKANGNTVTLPIRVVVNNGDVTDGNVNTYLQTHNLQVTVVPGQAATQFVFNDPNPSVPVTSARAITIFVGFDEGAPKAKKKVAGG